MMKTILTLILGLMFFVSCGNDKSVSPVKRQVSGFWYGETTLPDGKIEIDLEISGPVLDKIGGSGEFRFDPVDTTVTNIDYVIVGTFIDPIMQFNFQEVESASFSGSLQSDGRTLSGKLYTTYSDSADIEFVKLD